MDRADILEENITKLYYLLWGQCTEALQHFLRGYEYFEDKYISFYANWLLHPIKVTPQCIKEERCLNTYDSVYKLFRPFLNFRQSDDESCDKFMKHLLDFRSPLNMSDIDVRNQSHLTDKEYKKLVKADPNKSTTLEKKEAASSSSEALTSMVFCPVQIITDSNR